MKRILSAFIALLLAASMFSCSNETTEGKTGETLAQTTTAETTSSETGKPGIPEPDLPYETYGGEDFTLMYKGEEPYFVKGVWAEELNGEVVNDAVFNRNLEAEKKFEVKIVGRPETGDPSGLIPKSISSGDYICDVIWAQLIPMLAQSQQGYYVNLLNLPHVNYDAQYWDSNMVRDMTVADKLYMMNSDISTYFSEVRFIYFNKGVLEMYNMTSPYEHVYNDTWTLDVFADMSKSVSADLNGDGELNGHDRFGLLEEYPTHFLVGAGVQFTKLDDEGVPVVSCMNEKTVAILEKIASFTQDEKSALNYADAASGMDTSDFLHMWDYGRSLFAADHFLFVQNGAGVTVQFRDMESDYGIVPNPKYDENQERYYHLYDPHAWGMAIPTTNLELDKTGMILEYMSWKSNELLIPAYYETTIMDKRLRDEDAPKMLDIIRASTRYEVSCVLQVGLDNIFMDAEEKGNLISSYEKRSKTITKKLEKLADKYNKLD
ncbi:MAG: hypothetical protein IJA85_09040 [Clostridia bacterium]|nr:hypothetical protein [Clostridia bacterium]